MKQGCGLIHLLKFCFAHMVFNLRLPTWHLNMVAIGPYCAAEKDVALEFNTS